MLSQILQVVQMQFLSHTRGSIQLWWRNSMGRPLTPTPFGLVSLNAWKSSIRQPFSVSQKLRGRLRFRSYPCLCLAFSMALGAESTWGRFRDRHRRFLRVLFVGSFLRERYRWWNKHLRVWRTRVDCRSLWAQAIEVEAWWRTWDAGNEHRDP
jgi:hypothetical protein